jgi:hypothetical protein
MLYGTALLPDRTKTLKTAISVLLPKMGICMSTKITCKYTIKAHYNISHAGFKRRDRTV